MDFKYVWVDCAVIHHAALRSGTDDAHFLLHHPIRMNENLLHFDRNVSLRKCMSAARRLYPSCVRTCALKATRLEVLG